MIKINLLPPEIEKKAAARKKIFLAAIAGAVVVFIFAGSFLMRIAKVASLKNDLKKVTAELKTYEEQKKFFDDIKKQKESLQTRLDNIKKLMASQLNYPKMMEVMTLPDVLPANVWLKTFNTRDAGEAGINFTFAVEAADNYAVANLLTNLYKSSYFSKEDIVISGFAAGAGADGKKTRTLSVKCIYKPAGVKAQ